MRVASCLVFVLCVTRPLAAEEAPLIPVEKLEAAGDDIR